MRTCTPGPLSVVLALYANGGSLKWDRECNGEPGPELYSA